MRRIEKAFASIQARLLSVFFISALLSIAIVFVFNQWLRAQLITEADNALMVSAMELANRVDEFNRSNQQVFNVGSRLPSLVDYLVASEAERSDVEFQTRIRIILDSLEVEPWDEYYILSQAILNQDGINILDTAPENMGADESQTDYFRAAFIGSSINISPIEYRPERGGVYFYYGIPLRSREAPNSILGVLRIQVAIATVQNIILENARGQNVSMFDQNFVRIVETEREDLLFRSIATYTPDEIRALQSDHVLPPLPDDELSQPLPALVELLRHTHQTQVTSGPMLPDGPEERIAIVKLQTVPWYLVMSQASSPYFETAQRQTTGLAVLAIALTIIALLASLIISRRITDPIRALTEVAEQVAEGQLNIKAPVTSKDEVGTLAHAFNVMTAELQLAHDTLEDRVVKRTQELSETNERLKHEILERERYERQALDLAIEHERRRILSEFIQKASHEFKTPLSIINVNSHLIKRLLPEERQRLLNTIDDQTKYIDGLVSRMVLMSRLDSGISPAMEHLAIDEIVRALCANAESSYQEKPLTLTVDLCAPDAWVLADRDFLLIALQNLLDNALKYSDDQVEIRVSSRMESEMLSLTIADKGVGIPVELQARVFERFYRVDEAHSTRGFGLGLPIAKRIIESSGGTIDLTSTVGGGTTVTVLLPATIKPEHRPLLTGQPQSADTSSSAMLR